MRRISKLSFVTIIAIYYLSLKIIAVWLLRRSPSILWQLWELFIFCSVNWFQRDYLYPVSLINKIQIYTGSMKSHVEHYYSHSNIKGQYRVSKNLFGADNIFPSNLNYLVTFYNLCYSQLQTYQSKTNNYCLIFFRVSWHYRLQQCPRLHTKLN